MSPKLFSNKVTSPTKLLEIRNANYERLFQRVNADVWLQVFNDLSPKDLINLRRACKQFNDLAIGHVYNIYHCDIFLNAAQQGNIDTLLEIYHFKEGRKWEIKQKEMIQYRNYLAFKDAVMFGKIDVIQKMAEWTNETERRTMLRSGNYQAVIYALRFANFDALDEFLKWGNAADEIEIDKMVKQYWG